MMGIVRFIMMATLIFSRKIISMEVIKNEIDGSECDECHEGKAAYHIVIGRITIWLCQADMYELKRVIY